METVKPNTLPNAYSSLGVRQQFEPVHPDKMRMLLLGASGSGKTTFLASMENNIILDFENGSREVINPKAHRVWVRTYEDYKKILNQLVGDAQSKKPYFTRISIDSGDAWLTDVSRAMALEKSDPSRNIKYETMADFGSKGKGWSILYNRLLFDLDTLYSLGYSWAVTSHIIEKEITKTVQTPKGPRDQTVIVKRPILPRGIIGPIEGKTELTCCIENHSGFKSGTETKTITGGKTVVVPTPESFVQEHILRIEREGIREEGKHRLTGLAGEVNLPVTDGYKAFVSYWKTALAKLEKTIPKTTG